MLKNPEQLWEDLRTFRYNGMLTMKNLDNDLPTESCDSMYQTGFYMVAAALRLKRTKDPTLQKDLQETLQTIFDNGITFRGFNSDGEYWSGHGTDKIRETFGDKEIIGDVSRDQLMSLVFGLYFCNYALSADEFPLIQDRVLQIARSLVGTFEEKDYDLGTTYGNCKTHSLPLSLALHEITKESPIRYPFRSRLYFNFVSDILAIIDSTYHYSNYVLMVLSLFLIANSTSDEISEDFRNSVKNHFLKIVRSRGEDQNLLFELLYYFTYKEFAIERDGSYREILNEIFEKTPQPKVQDFVWKRSTEFRYKSHDKDQNKNFYAPWHDYLIVDELLHDLDLD